MEMGLGVRWYVPSVETGLGVRWYSTSGRVRLVWFSSAGDAPSSV